MPSVRRPDAWPCSRKADIGVGPTPFSPEGVTLAARQPPLKALIGHPVESWQTTSNAKEDDAKPRESHVTTRCGHVDILESLMVCLINKNFRPALGRKKAKTYKRIALIVEST